MTIDKELEAKILRLHHVEKWGVHTIARQLPVHHTAVERVLSQTGVPAPERGQRSSIRDANNDFIVDRRQALPETHRKAPTSVLKRNHLRSINKRPINFVQRWERFCAP